MPKYDNIVVQITGSDGNAMLIIGTVVRAMKHAKVPASDVSAFTDEATSGDYDNVLQTAMKWVNVS